MAEDINGQIMRPRFTGRDSCLLPSRNNWNSQYLTDTVHLELAEIKLAQPEPVWSNTLVTLEMCKGGFVTSVAWPGPNVAVTPSGVAGAVIKGIHGLYEAPMPGQQVLLGFVEGNIHSPIVVQKYAYNPSQNPLQSAAYELPLTGQGHFATDVVLGHYLGSYLAFRGTIPLPAQIEMSSQAGIGIDAQVDFIVSAIVEISMDAGKISLTDISGTYNISIDPTASKIDVVSGAGAQINVKSGVGGIINIQAGAGANVNIKPGAGAFLNLGNSPANFCNNLPACLFTAAPHSTSIDTKA